MCGSSSVHLEAALRSPWLIAGCLAAAALLVLLARAPRHVTRLDRALSLLALVVLPTAPLLAGGRRGWEMAKEAGSFAVPAMATSFLALGAILALRRRGEEGSSVLVPVALVPAAAGLLGARAALAHRVAMLRAEGLDPLSMGHVLANIESEALPAAIAGLALSSILCLVPAFGRPLITSLLLGFFVVVAVVHGSDFPVAAVGLVAIVVVLASLDEGGEDEGTAMAAAAALLLAGLGAIAQVHRRGLDLIAGTRVDRAQYVSAIRDMLLRERAGAVVVLLGVSAVVVQAGRRAQRRRAARRGRVAWARLVPGLAALAALVAAIGWQRATYDAWFARSDTQSDRFASTPELTLPGIPWEEGVSLVLDQRGLDRYGGPAFWVTRDGALLASAGAGPPRPYAPSPASDPAAPQREDAAPPLLAADAGLRLDALLRALAPIGTPRRTPLLLVAETPALDVRGVERYRGMFPDNRLLRFEVLLLPDLSVAPEGGAVAPEARRRALGISIHEREDARAVVLDGRAGSYRMVPGVDLTDMHIGPSGMLMDARSRVFERAGHVDEVVLGCPPSMAVGDLVRVMLVVTTVVLRTEAEMWDPRRPGPPPEVPRFVVSPDTKSLDHEPPAQ